MSRSRARPKGAERRSEASPFGNQAYRREWQARAAAFTTLAAAVGALMEWRKLHADLPIADKDALWVEARLEERVAVLRFQELPHEAIRTRTLTGEAIADVLADFGRRAAAGDATALEALAAELRRRFKPPIMPSSPYLRLEMLICGQLMQRRSVGWFEPSIAELRARRGATVLKEGWPEVAKAAAAAS